MTDLREDDTNVDEDSGYVPYSPEAVRHDLQIIKNLKGRSAMTNAHALEIYRKIRRENIEFQSEIGNDFLGEVVSRLTDEQIISVNRRLNNKKVKKRQGKMLLRINRNVMITLLSILIILCVIILNRNLLMDVRTSVETMLLRKRISQPQITQENDDADSSVAQQAAENIAENITEEISDSVTNKTEGYENNYSENYPDNYSDNIYSDKSDTDTTASDGVNSASASPEKEENAQPDDVQREVLDKFKELYGENQDFAGWLRIEGTKIDYPVMLRDGDNDYYLDKNFEGKKDKNGLLIMDYRSADAILSDKAMQNIIIYGHNMKTGVMFGTLKNFKDKEYAQAHSAIDFDSIYDEYEYKVIASVLSEVAYEDEAVFRYYDVIDLSDEGYFDEFKNYITDNALFVLEDFSYGDSFMMLSTCDSHTEDGRFVVIAKRVN